MTAARFDRVTEAQRECLRLVLTRRNSKEIALALDVSSHTVDKRLGRACAWIGVSNRFDAARMLAEHEGTLPAPAPEQTPSLPADTYEPLVYQSPDVVPPPLSDKIGMSEALATVGGGDAANAAWLPLRPKGGRGNTLTVWQRLLWILTIPAALAVAVGMLGFGLSVAGKLFRVIGAVLS